MPKLYIYAPQLIQFYLSVQKIEAYCRHLNRSYICNTRTGKIIWLCSNYNTAIIHSHSIFIHFKWIFTWLWAAKCLTRRREMKSNRLSSFMVPLGTAFWKDYINIIVFLFPTMLALIALCINNLEKASWKWIMRCIRKGVQLQKGWLLTLSEIDFNWNRE